MNIFSEVARGLVFSFAAFSFIVGGFFVGAGQARAASPQDVVISEFVSRPSAGHEWVELLNKTESAISLDGWKLTDLTNPQTSPEEVTMKLLSGTIPAKGILVFNIASATLNDSGDSIGLYDNSATPNLMDSVSYGSLAIGYAVTPGLNIAPDTNQSAALSADTSWSIVSLITKGWFNSDFSLNTIKNNLHDTGIETNIGDLENPSATPALETSDPKTSALYFEKPDQGRIVFEKSLNLTDQKTVLALQNLKDAVQISPKHIKFDSIMAEAMNAAGAKIYFYGLNTETQPTLVVKDDNGVIVNQDGVISNISYTTGACGVGETICKTFSFNTAHFTQFDLQNKADIYVDAVKPDDNGDGLTAATAKKTIQSGIASVDAGGTVHIAPGTYTESVLINKEVNLVKYGAADVIINGNPSSNYIVRVDNTNNVTLDGLTIDGTGSSVGANGFEYGILIAHSGTSNAPIAVKKSIVKNIWVNGADGINVDNGSYAILDHNTISSFHKRGVRFINSSGKFSNNEVIGDNVDGKLRVQNLVTLWGGSNVEIFGNKLHNALSVGGIAEWDSPAIFVSSYVSSGIGSPSQANIHDNEIYDGDTGITLTSFYADTDTSSAEIKNNNFHNLNTGVNFEKSTASVSLFTENKFSAIKKAVNADNGEGLIANPPVVAAERNWWGTANKSKISDLVYGGIDFDPYYLTETKTIVNDVAPTLVYVDKSYIDGTSGNHIFGYDAFSTIQAGINTVAPSGTVNVAPGTYVEENITVNKALTLQGSGYNSTVIDATGSTNIGKYVFNINLVSGNVKLDGFQIKNGKELNSIGVKSASADSIITITNNKIQGFGPSDKDTYDFGLIAGSPAKVVVQHNVFDNTSSNPILFEKQTGETLLDDNDFTGVAPSLWYMTYSGVDVTTPQKVSNNRIDASKMVGSFTAIGFASSYYDRTGSCMTCTRIGKYSNIEISGNTITGLKSFGDNDAKAISIANENNTDGLSGEITAPKITDNTISGTGGIGIQLIGYVTDAEVNNNNISGVRTGFKAFNGSYSANFYPVRATIHNNKIISTTVKALNWLGVDSLNVSNNWWGSAIKSDIQSNISGNVVFTPYYISEAKTTLSDLRSITSFTFPNQKGVTAINQETGTISLIMPYGTDVKALKPSFEITGQSLKVGDIAQISGETENDFTNSVIYKVYSIDGTTKDYVVTVIVMKNPAKSISALTIGNQIGNTVINEATHSIIVTLPHSVNVVSLAPTITITGASISPANGVMRDFTNPVTYTVTAADETTVDYIVKVILLTAIQTAPNEIGEVTVNRETPEVIVTNPTQAITVAIANETTNAKIDVSAFITNGTGTLPAMTITSANANNVSVSIPASTIVTSADPAWNGAIIAPKITNITLPNTSGQVTTLGTAIEIGFSGAKLSFDKAIRILMPGQANKKVGYVRTGIDFTEIADVCALDDQATGDALALEGDCKINSGSDLAIWTKHFTSFATYTQTAVTGGGGGGGGGGYIQPTTKKGDANNDGKIDIIDFVALMANWNKTGSNIMGDYNNDAKVDVMDFVALMANWTK